MSARQRSLSNLAPSVDLTPETRFKYDVSGWKVFGLLVILGLIIAAILWFWRPDFVRTRTPLGIATDQIDLVKLVVASILGALALLGLLFWIKVIQH